MNSSERFRFGLYEVDLKAWELRKQGLKIKLQAQPFGVLAMLLERPGEIISREELRQKLWPADVFVDFDQALNKAVNKLRDALGDAAENPRFIETVPKRGYRFIAPIMKVRDGQDAAASSPSPGRGKWKYRTTAVASVVVLAIATCIAWIWARRSNTVYPLAVLPLSNSSSDANLDYLGDGITESIINNLSQLERLKVMARSTVFHYKGKPTDPRTIGRELGVRAVLTGRVYQLGDKVMVDTELIDVADGSRLWGAQYNRKLSDLITLQEDIAVQITSTLQMKLTGEQRRLLARRATANSDAYQLYLRGRYYFNKRSETGFLKAAEYFQQAIALDSNYALAYTGLADCYGLLGYDSYPPREYFPKAQAMVSKALEIDGQLAEAHTSQAMIKALYERDWAGAESEFRRAIALNSGYSTAHHWYGIHLEAMGRFEEARKELRRALELDPLS
ncbi:MAG TPA: winged helix-turn-helix domain-containing protein, partial [Terriglobales bacterium]